MDNLQNGSHIQRYTMSLGPFELLSKEFFCYFSLRVKHFRFFPEIFLHWFPLSIVEENLQSNIFYFITIAY
jgi:hypothetical protein